MEFEDASEISDLVGTTASIVQGADAGAVHGLGGGSLGTQPVPRQLTYGGGGYGASPYLDPPEMVTPEGIGIGGNLIGAITGVIGAVGGARDLLDEKNSTTKKAIGAGNLYSGGIGALGSFMGLAEASHPLLAGLANAGGAAGLGAEVGAGATWLGASGTAAGAAGTLLSTSAAVVGAGLAGLGVGTYGDDAVRASGLLHGEGGGPLSLTGKGGEIAFDMANRFGGADSIGGQIAAGGTSALLAIPGAHAAMLGTIVGTNVAAGKSAMSALSALYHWAD